MLKKVLLSFVMWLVIATASVAGYLWQWLHAPMDISVTHRVLELERGTNLYRVADILSGRGLLHWPRVWIWYARIKNDTAIHAGEYQLGERESPLSILQRLRDGKTMQHYVTLVEGQNVYGVLDSLRNAHRLQQTLERPPTLDGWHINGINVDYLEGWFFPDTYAYIKGDTDVDILIRAHKHMQLELGKAWSERADNLPYKNVYQALIMASIIEKETGHASERQQIAGVFVRRLQKGMRLQTDPTVIYGMGANYQGNIRRSDLKKMTPYNTYLIKGLPPTPIAMPGRESIYAALHPAPGKTLYFVARGDGFHQFSETLDEHNKAVVKYQLRRKNNYRSAPAAK